MENRLKKLECSQFLLGLFINCYETVLYEIKKCGQKLVQKTIRIFIDEISSKKLKKN